MTTSIIEKPSELNSDMLSRINGDIIRALKNDRIPWRANIEPVLLTLAPKGDIRRQAITGINRVILNSVSQRGVWADAGLCRARNWRAEVTQRIYNETVSSKLEPQVDPSTGEVSDVPVWVVILEEGIAVFAPEYAGVENELMAHKPDTRDIRADLRAIISAMNPRPQYFPLFKDGMYSARYDTIYMTSRSEFDSESAFWLEVLRLVILSTGHPARLNRFPNRKITFFLGNTDWRCLRERLIAEIVIWRLSVRYGLTDALNDRVGAEWLKPIEQRYFLTADQWLSQLDGSPLLLWSAARQSERVLTYFERLLTPKPATGA